MEEMKDVMLDDVVESASENAENSNGGVLKKAIVFGVGFASGVVAHIAIPKVIRGIKNARKARKLAKEAKKKGVDAIVETSDEE